MKTIVQQAFEFTLWFLLAIFGTWALIEYLRERRLRRYLQKRVPENTFITVRPQLTSTEPSEEVHQSISLNNGSSKPAESQSG